MKFLFRKVLSLALIFAMFLSLTTTAFAASNSPYIEGNPENIVITLSQLEGSTYQVTIRNDRDTAIGDWKLSFKTNFKLSNPNGVSWSMAKNNTYTFWDTENGSIASGDSFSFTVVSDKKKNSEIHNVSFEYDEVEEYDAYTKDTDNDKLYDWIEEYLGTDPRKDDSDADGLTDYDEIYVTLTDPAKFDSTGFGISDAECDFDMDGLNNYEEILRGSDPHKADTDSDTLNDADEILRGTNPTDGDTDKDGMPDGIEIPYGMDPTDPDTLNDGIMDGDRLFTVAMENDEAFDEYGIRTTVELLLLGSQVQSLSIGKIDTTDAFLSDEVPGFIGNAFEYTVDGAFESAEISFAFPEELLSDDDFDPAIFYFDEETQILIPLEEQIVSGHTVTARTTHFSKYILLNKTEYTEAWEYEIKFDSSAESYKNIDVAFVIDSSGSMTSNDKNNIRKNVTKDFINKLSSSDRGAVIDFDSYSTVYSDFTSDKAVLSSAVDRINSSGGTDLSKGIQAAINLFVSPSYVNSGRLKIIIMLTDGDGSYNTNLTQTAKNNGIIIYTVGLGNAVSVSRLSEMSEGTGGNYYPASDAEKLYGIFDEIAEEADLKKDSDGDGISDYFEKEMNAGRLRLGTGVPLLGMDYLNEDSDGDTLKDGVELSVEKSGKFLGFIGSEKIYVRLYSNPTCPDTDGDGIVDSKDERPLYPFRFQYLGSDEHLNYVEEQMALKMQDAYLYGDNVTTMMGMWGTEILMDDYSDFLSYKGVDPTGKYREDYWDSDWDKYWNAYCDEINSYVSLRGSVGKDLHYFRNNLNRIPATLGEMVSNPSGWTLLPVGQSTYHMCPTDFSGSGLYNLKFISNDGKFEGVYVNNETNKNNGFPCTERTDPMNMGTYNYCGEYINDKTISVSGGKHFLFDMLPYFSLGNTSPLNKQGLVSENESRFGQDLNAQNIREQFKKNDWEKAGGNKLVERYNEN